MKKKVTETIKADLTTKSSLEMMVQKSLYHRYHGQSPVVQFKMGGQWYMIKPIKL